MAKKLRDNLVSRLRNPYPADPALEQLLKDVVASPRAQSSFNLCGPASVDSLLTQHYKTDLSTLWVRREGCIIDLGWKIAFEPRWREYYPVFGSIYEIAFEPDQSKVSGGLFYAGVSDGCTTIELEEGCSYLIEFHFVLLSHGDGQPLSDSFIAFTVSIPLSGERKALLNEATKWKDDPKERVRLELRQFLAKQAAFEDAQQEAMQLIKAKGLSPEETERRLIEISEYTERLKEKFGL